MRIEELTMEEILRVIDSFKVRHVHQAREGKKLLNGYVENYKREIVLSENTFESDRLYTVCHELLHASDFLRGYDSDEKHTIKRTDKNYRRIFGHDFLG